MNLFWNLINNVNMEKYLRALNNIYLPVIRSLVETSNATSFVLLSVYSLIYYIFKSVSFLNWFLSSSEQTCRSHHCWIPLLHRILYDKRWNVLILTPVRTGFSRSLHRRRFQSRRWSSCSAYLLVRL